MSRLTDEQVVPFRTDADKADTPEAREARIQAHERRIEAMGLAGPITQQRVFRSQAQSDASIASAVRAGARHIDIAADRGIAKSSVYRAIRRAEERERRAAEHSTAPQKDDKPPESMAA